MNQKSEIVNTSPAKPARKKDFTLTFGLIFTFLLLLIPVYGLRQYAQTLESQRLFEPTQVDCGVVLTGAAGRVREAMALLSHNYFQKLIISGAHQRATLSDMFPEILFYPEIKLENVILERRSNSTASNAQNSLQIVDAFHCQSVMLITSDYHMYRALKTFKHFFPGTIQITPYLIPSDRLHFRRNVFFDTRFWGTVLEEWTKYLFYEVTVFSSSPT